MVPLFLQGLFLPAALPKTFNQHTAAKLLPKQLSRLPRARAAAANPPVGPGLQGLQSPSQALIGVRVSSYQTRIKKPQGHREVHILTTFTDPTLIKQD